MFHNNPEMPVHTYHSIRQQYEEGNRDFYVEKTRDGSFIQLGNLTFVQDNWLQDFITNLREDYKTQTNDYNGGPLEGYDRTKYFREYVANNITPKDAQFIMMCVPDLINIEFYRGHSTLQNSYRFSMLDVIVEAFAEWVSFRV